MTGPESYAIILTHNRPELLRRCVGAVASQVNLILVLDNASDPPVNDRQLWREAINDTEQAALLVANIPDQPANLSRLWNHGYGVIAALASSRGLLEWDLVMLCDDAIIPDGWVSLVASGMRQYGCAAASTHQAQQIHSPIVKTAPDRDIWNRMCPWAHVLAGEKRLRADEQLHWWWSDTHIDWLARQAGGVVILPGPLVPNERPNDFLTTVPGLAEQAGRDGQRFREIWGEQPW